jgi:nitroimidazol reductase NimA-like FMN-containing flavoprotein (pyridoxamine 5'-phosphate oxidase superfamily)
VTVQDIVAANRYMVLATADEQGVPWATPVWFATEDHRRFYWISDPNTRHSRNIAARPEIAIVIFDSTQPINTGRGVYAKAVAEQVANAEVDRVLQIFSERSVAHGGEVWTREHLEPLRLYRATASEYSMLGPGMPRAPVALGSSA